MDIKNQIKFDGSLERLKAHLVAQGATQVLGIDFDEHLVLLLNLQFFRVILSHNFVNNWLIRQVDVKSASLNGFLKKQFCGTTPRFY